MMFNENQVFVQISEQAYDYALCTRMFYNNVTLYIKVLFWLKT